MPAPMQLDRGVYTGPLAEVHCRYCKYDDHSINDCARLMRRRQRQVETVQNSSPATGPNVIPVSSSRPVSSSSSSSATPQNNFGRTCTIVCAIDGKPTTLHRPVAHIFVHVLHSPYRFSTLADTGASQSSVSPRVLTFLKIQPILPQPSDGVMHFQLGHRDHFIERIGHITLRVNFEFVGEGCEVENAKDNRFEMRFEVLDSEADFILGTDILRTLFSTDRHTHYMQGDSILARAPRPIDDDFSLHPSSSRAVCSSVELAVHDVSATLYTLTRSRDQTDEQEDPYWRHLNNSPLPVHAQSLPSLSSPLPQASSVAPSSSLTFPQRPWSQPLPTFAPNHVDSLYDTAPSPSPSHSSTPPAQ